MIAPLSDAAVKSIVRVSEDNLSLLSADEMAARKRRDAIPADVDT